jgi:hypothetical protein
MAAAVDRIRTSKALADCLGSRWLPRSATSMVGVSL